MRIATRGKKALYSKPGDSVHNDKERRSSKKMQRKRLHLNQKVTWQSPKGNFAQIADKEKGMVEEAHRPHHQMKMEKNKERSSTGQNTDMVYLGLKCQQIQIPYSLSKLKWGQAMFPLKAVLGSGYFLQLWIQRGVRAGMTNICHGNNCSATSAKQNTDPSLHLIHRSIGRNKSYTCFMTRDILGRSLLLYAYVVHNQYTYKISFGKKILLITLFKIFKTRVVAMCWV